MRPAGQWTGSVPAKAGGARLHCSEQPTRGRQRGGLLARRGTRTTRPFRRSSVVRPDLAKFRQIPFLEVFVPPVSLRPERPLHLNRTPARPIGLCPAQPARYRVGSPGAHTVAARAAWRGNSFHELSSFALSRGSMDTYAPVRPAGPDPAPPLDADSAAGVGQCRPVSGCLGCLPISGRSPPILAAAEFHTAVTVMQGDVLAAVPRHGCHQRPRHRQPFAAVQQARPRRALPPRGASATLLVQAPQRGRGARPTPRTRTRVSACASARRRRTRAAGGPQACSPRRAYL